MQSTLNKANYKVGNTVSDFSLLKFLKYCYKRWVWFALSFMFFLLLSVAYVMRKEPVYERHTDILIENQDVGATAEISNVFSSMGLVSNNTSVQNELISFASPAIMFEVVKRLDLTTSYIRKNFPHNITLYGSNLPFKVEFPDLGDDKSASFKITYNPDGSATLQKFITVVNGKRVKFPDVINVRAGQTQVRTPFGRLNIIPNPVFKGLLSESIQVVVQKKALMVCVETYTSKLGADLVNQDADVIDLSIRDTNVERACDILNAIVSVYNENWVEYKNRMAVATSTFIDERLKVLEKELGVVDNEISDFKSQNHIADPLLSAEMRTRQNLEMDNDMLKAHNELAMTGYLYDYLNDPANKSAIIPMNSGVNNPTLEQQISAYNNLLLSRNNLAANSSTTNPIVVEYDNQLKGQREAIIRAVASQRSQVTAAIRNMEGAKGKSDNQLANAPKQAKMLLGVERQQKVMEELYLYLLQKREENQLTQTFTAYNTRVITPPTGLVDPVAPKGRMIVLMAIVFSIALPLVIFYVMMNADTKVRNRKDLENTNIPFLGEVPSIGKTRKIRKLLRSRKKNKELADAPLFVVEEGNRNVANEAFRVIRSSLSMMFGKEKKCHVVLFTSFNPGSGKSFISYNLAAAFVLKNFKVLVIDGDLRHGSASSFVGKPRKGLADYLLSDTNDWQSLVVKGKEKAVPDVLPIGKMPPNPAELLENDRIGQLVEEARNNYDLIIFDCPPVDIVVDAQIIEQYVDRTIFVVRAGLLQKGAVAEIEELYQSKRFKKMSLLLNGTEESESRYQTYGSYQNLEAKR